MTARPTPWNGLWLLAATLTCVSACAENTRNAPASQERDSGLDASTDAEVDSGSDAADDAGLDSGLDASTDAGRDSGSDASDEAELDSGLDASTDAEEPRAFCGANEHVVSHACAPCADGTTNAAGDDPRGADTECDGTLCPIGYRVSDHACVACPEGFDSPLADDPAGPDTHCSCTTAWSRPDAECAFCWNPASLPPHPEECERENQRPMLLLNDEYKEEFYTLNWWAQPSPLRLTLIDIDSLLGDSHLYAVRVELSSSSDAAFDVTALALAAAEYCAQSSYISSRDVLLVCIPNAMNLVLPLLELLPPTSEEERTTTVTVTASDNGWSGSEPLSHTLKLYVTWMRAPN